MFQRVFTQFGVRGFFMGLVPSLMRDVPFSAVYWSVYETLAPRLRTMTVLPRAKTDCGIEEEGECCAAGERTPLVGSFRRTFAANFVAGAVSGSAAALVTMPFDVLKTTVQVQQRQGQSLATTVRQLVAAEGWGALMKGLVPRMVRIAPASAITISTYEIVKRVLSHDAV